MKTLILFLALVLFAPFISGQEQNKQGDVELPSFVITGKASESFTPLTKPASVPVFPVLTGITGSTPAAPYTIEKQYNIPFEVKAGVKKDSALPLFVNRLKIEAGNITTPSVDMLYTSFFKDGRLTLAVNGFNNRDYQPNANEYLLLPEIGVKFSVGDGTDFPLSNLDSKLAYSFNSFNYRGFTDSIVQIKAGRLHPAVSFTTTTDNSFWVELKLAADMLNVSALNLKNTEGSSTLLLSLGGKNLRMSGSIMLLGGSGGYNNVKKDYRFFETKADITLQFTGFRLKAGAYYAGDRDASYFNPTAIVELPLGAGLSLFGSYGGSVSMFTPGTLFGVNKYVSQSPAVKYTQRLEHTLEAGISILNKDLFELNASAGYSAVPGYLYSDFNQAAKRFSFASAKADLISGAFKATAFFNTSGTITAQLKYNRVTDKNSNVFPFVPQLQGKGEFYYSFSSQWALSTGFDYVSESYTDFSNTARNSGIISPFLNGYYKTGPATEFGLLLSNLLNRKNALINGIELPGFEVNLHFRYVW